MVVQSISPHQSCLHPFVRSLMLMEIRLDSSQPTLGFGVPAMDVASLMIPIQGCDRYIIQSPIGGNVIADKPLFHGQISQNSNSLLNIYPTETAHIVMFGIIFTPLGLQHFLRPQTNRMDALHNRFIEASGLLTNIHLLAEELEEAFFYFNRCRTSPHTTLQSLQMLAVLAEKFLCTILMNKIPTVSLSESRNFEKAEYIVRHLIKTNGKVRIAEIARGLGISERQSLRIMLEYVGVSGKTFGEVQRFLQASRLLIQSALDLTSQGILNTQRLHTIIHETGYYDQSHCIRDFKRFSGKTPLQFLRERHALVENLIDTDVE